MRLAEEEIARIAAEAGIEEAAQATVMTAVRMLGTLYFVVGFEAAIGALRTIHDAAEGEIMRLSIPERANIDAELERIGIKVAANPQTTDNKVPPGPAPSRP
jgi:hypothetical protein